MGYEGADQEAQEHAAADHPDSLAPKESTELARLGAKGDEDGDNQEAQEKAAADHQDTLAQKECAELARLGAKRNEDGEGALPVAQPDPEDQSARGGKHPQREDQLEPSQPREVDRREARSD